MDEAATRGDLDLIKKYHKQGKQCTISAINNAAENGHLQVVEWLHYNRKDGCTKNAMHRAAMNGHLTMVEWLHRNRSEGCTRDAMDHAAKNGHLQIIQWLHHNRTEGCTKNAMDAAARNGHLDIVEWLHMNRLEGCTHTAINLAAENDYPEIVKFLHRHIPTDGDISNMSEKAYDIFILLHTRGNINLRSYMEQRYLDIRIRDMYASEDAADDGMPFRKKISSIKTIHRSK